MKRPVGFYFVAVWFGLGLFIQSIGPLRALELVQKGDASGPTILRLVPLVAVMFHIWMIIGFVKLKPFHRWFAIVFFIVSTLAMFVNSLRGNSDHTLRPSEALLVYSALGTIGAINAASVYYLWRRSFREFSVQFVAERDKEKNSRIMAEAAQRRLRDESRKH